MRFKSIFVMAVIPVLAILSASQATLLSGTGGAAAALPGDTVIGFEAAPDGLYNSLTLDGVTFSGVGAPFTIGPDYNGQYNTDGGSSLFNGFGLTPDAFRVDFTGTVNEFAFNWGAADNIWTLTAFDSSNNVIESDAIAPTSTSNAGDYYGISAPGIKYITIVDTNNVFTGDYVFMDDFTSPAVVTVGGVPEPVTASLGLIGLIGLGLAASRRRHA